MTIYRHDGIDIIIVYSLINNRHLGPAILAFVDRHLGTSSHFGLCRVVVLFEGYIDCINNSSACPSEVFPLLDCPLSAYFVCVSTFVSISG